MIIHEPLVETVAAQARLADTDEAARVVKVTIAALAHQLEMPQRQRLRQELPGPERDAALVIVPPAGGGARELAIEIGHNLETRPSGPATWRKPCSPRSPKPIRTWPTSYETGFRATAHRCSGLPSRTPNGCTPLPRPRLRSLPVNSTPSCAAARNGAGPSST